MADTFHVKGLDGVIDRLKELGALGGKTGGPLKEGLRKGANLIRDAAIANAPRDTGFMAEQITTSRDGKPHLVGATEHFWVGVKRGKKAYANTKRNRGRGRVGKTYNVDGNAYYWRFLEFGTAKLRPRPFLRPAFEANKEAAVNAIVTGIDKAITRIAKKVRR